LVATCRSWKTEVRKGNSWLNRIRSRIPTKIYNITKYEINMYMCNLSMKEFIQREIEKIFLQEQIENINQHRSKSKLLMR